MIAFSGRGEIPLKHSIKNSLQRTKRSCKKGLGRDKGEEKRWRMSSFIRVEYAHAVTQHVAGEPGLLS